MVTCENCGLEFNPSSRHKHDDHIYCSVCRKYHKNCEICGKEIFVQARTCSRKCAYELRKKSWEKSCGAPHNFSKHSLSRKKWEEKLLEEEGITNVFQRESVKNKCKDSIMKRFGVDHPSKSNEIKSKKESTCLKNHGVKNGLLVALKNMDDLMLKRYGKLRITNGSKISNIRLSPEFRKKMENLGRWKSMAELAEYEIYGYHVWQITRQHIKLYGETYLGESYDRMIHTNSSQKDYKLKLSIDHKYSINEGFKFKISPEIIGSIINLDIINFSENSSKNKNCSITKESLMSEYTKFLNNENKINKENSF